MCKASPAGKQRCFSVCAVFSPHNSLSYPLGVSTSVKGLVRLLRPLNFVLFVAGVALGGILAAGFEVFRGSNLSEMILAMCSAACIGGAANAINDVYDIEIDRVNRPVRPLPSGEVSESIARALWVVLSFVGIALGLFVSLLHAFIALGVAVLLWLYSFRFKRKLLVGNVVISIVLGLAILYGGLVPAVGSLTAVLVGAAFAFLTTFVREIIKDIEDIRGDQEQHARTLPIVLGSGFAARVALGVLVLTLIALPIPTLIGFSRSFLGYIIPAGCALLYVAWPLLTISSMNADTQRAASTSSRWMKITMVLGVAALAVSQL